MGTRRTEIKNLYHRRRYPADTRYRKPIIRLIGLTFLTERFIHCVNVCAQRRTLNFGAQEHALHERPEERVRSAEVSGVKIKIKR